MFYRRDMSADELMEALESLSLARSDLAKLIHVTQRAVSLWCSGDREVPGPVIAYLRLLQSLPKALRAQELARIQENAMRYEGMYAVEFTGHSGSGICALVLMGGCIFGHDSGVFYDGTYEPNQRDPNHMDLTLQLTVPAGVALVQGVAAQPAEYTFPLQLTLPARGVSNLEVATPYGPVRCTVRFLRPLPAQLAA